MQLLHLLSDVIKGIKGFLSSITPLFFSVKMLNREIKHH